MGRVTYEDIKDSVDAGKDLETIAAEQTRRSDRYPEQRFTINEIAVRLSDIGKDANTIVTDLIEALTVEAEYSYLVKGKLAELERGGTIDLGSYLQRAMIKQLVADNRIDSEYAQDVLDLVEVPAEITTQEIIDAIAEEDARIAEEAEAASQRAAEEAKREEINQFWARFHAKFNEYVLPAFDGGAAIGDASVVSGLQDLVDNWNA